LDDLLRVTLRGGWPGSLDFTPEQGQFLARDYLRSLAERDVPDVDDTRRDPAKVTALLRSLARHTASTASVATIRRDTAGTLGDELSKITAAAYLDGLRRLYAVIEVPAWSPNLRSATRLKSAPKRLLADPSLAVAALQATGAMMKSDLNTLGFVFEALCLRDLLAITESLGGMVYHYQDDSGLEADAVVELPDGSWAAIEIKLGFNQIDAAAASLLRLAAKLDYTQRRRGQLIALVGLGAFPHTRADGVHVIPIEHLGR
jgi:predicted AAA+ superfamily ATPase